MDCAIIKLTLSWSVSASFFGKSVIHYDCSKCFFMGIVVNRIIHFNWIAFASGICNNHVGFSVMNNLDPTSGFALTFFFLKYTCRVFYNPSSAGNWWYNYNWAKLMFPLFNNPLETMTSLSEFVNKHPWIVSQWKSLSLSLRFSSCSVLYTSFFLKGAVCLWYALAF